MTAQEHRGAFAQESLDLQALEQFATSIAALARDEARPTEVLSSVLQTIAENLNACSAGPRRDKDSILLEKALQIGYQNPRQLEQDLLHLIGERMLDLRGCHLTAIEREQKRMIMAL